MVDDEDHLKERTDEKENDIDQLHIMRSINGS